jgi:hypothetical protein
MREIVKNQTSIYDAGASAASSRHQTSQRARRKNIQLDEPAHLKFFEFTLVLLRRRSLKAFIVKRVVTL